PRILLVVLVEDGLEERLNRIGAGTREGHRGLRLRVAGRAQHRVRRAWRGGRGRAPRRRGAATTRAAACRDPTDQSKRGPPDECFLPPASRWARDHRAYPSIPRAPPPWAG